MTERKTCASCDEGTCPAKKRRPNETEADFAERQALTRRTRRIKRKIFVLSGKGGVGKSTVATNLAASFALDDGSVGLLDVDIHGPSVPKLLGLERDGHQTSDDGILPVMIGDSLKVMSIGFFLENPDDAVIWRGPMKMGVIKQFLKDVEWGDLDLLIVDSPPGTGDEPLSVCQLLEDADGAVIVTTPQEVALADVRKSINFCRKLNLRVLGVVENMSGFVCPKCGEVTNIFKRGGAERMAVDMNVPFLGRLPLDPMTMAAGENGRPVVSSEPDSSIAEEFRSIKTKIKEQLK